MSTGVARRAKLRSAASAAVRVLELTTKDIGPDLATLLEQVLLSWIRTSWAYSTAVYSCCLLVLFCYV